MRRLFVTNPLFAVLLLAACSGSSTAVPTLGPSTTIDLSTPTPEANAGSLAGLPDIAGVVERVAPAVVQVLATVEQTNVFGQTTDGRSQGSGVFFTDDGYLLTNNHATHVMACVFAPVSADQRSERQTYTRYGDSAHSGRPDENQRISRRAIWPSLVRRDSCSCPGTHDARMRSSRGRRFRRSSSGCAWTNRRTGR